MKRRREDFRYPSDTTVYARRALVIVLVLAALLVLIIGVLMMR